MFFLWNNFVGEKSFFLVKKFLAGQFLWGKKLISEKKVFFCETSFLLDICFGQLFFMWKMFWTKTKFVLWKMIFFVKKVFMVTKKGDFFSFILSKVGTKFLINFVCMKKKFFGGKKFFGHFCHFCHNHHYFHYYHYYH